jgi:hypothetical protein
MPMLSNAAITRMGLSDRFAEPEDRSGGAPALRGHLANMVGVCHSLSVALAGSSP